MLLVLNSFMNKRSVILRACCVRSFDDDGKIARSRWTDLYLSGVCQPGLVGDVVVDLKPVVSVTVKVAVVDGDLLNTRETVASRDAIARRVAFNRTFSRRRLRTTCADP